mmetsp:Transcript_2935/g.4714  ORF Transcript_2935/g.4714 Transcript_2935/m.4714 type:complete len:204 (-) Transcript_2935:1367-1978(-)
MTSMTTEMLIEGAKGGKARSFKGERRRKGKRKGRRRGVGEGMGKRKNIKGKMRRVRGIGVERADIEGEKRRGIGGQVVIQGQEREGRGIGNLDRRIEILDQDTPGMKSPGAGEGRRRQVIPDPDPDPDPLRIQDPIRTPGLAPPRTPPTPSPCRFSLPRRFPIQRVPPLTPSLLTSIPRPWRRRRDMNGPYFLRPTAPPLRLT